MVGAHAVAAAADVDDDGVVDQAVHDGGGNDLVGEDLTPVREAAVAIYVESGSLSMWQERLVAAGFKVVGPIAFSHGNRSVFVANPDGNVVELADWIVDWSAEGIERPG